MDRSVMKNENIRPNSNKKITEFVTKLYNSPSSNNATKKTSSILSPPENMRDSKKLNIEQNMDTELEQEQSMSISQLTKRMHTKEATVQIPDTKNLQHILGPLMNEFKLLREIVDKNYTKLDEVQQEISLHQSKVSQELQNLESTISTQRKEIIEEIGENLENTNQKIEAILLENKQLKRENQNLRDCLDRLETAQLSNNIIITGIEEQTWELVEVTKQRVYDTITATIESSDGNTALDEAYKVNVVHCSRVGKYKPNANRPITMTFQRREDKDRLMKTKSRLPIGVHVNNELPLEVKKKQDQQQPIFRMVKSLPDYRDCCKLIGDALTINGIRYTADDIHKLPPEIAAYKSSEKKMTPTWHSMENGVRTAIFIIVHLN